MTSTRPENEGVAILAFAVRVVVFAVLLMPIIVTTSTFFPFVVGKAVYARVMTEIAVLFWVPLIIISTKYRPRFHWIFVAISSYICISFISAIMGVSFQVSFWSTFERMQGINDLIHWMIYITIMVSICRSKQDWITLITLNLLVSVIVCSIGIGHFVQVNLISSLFPFITENTRLESTLGNATYIGAFCGTNLFLGAALTSLSLQGRSNSTVNKADRQIKKRRSQRRRRTNPNTSNSWYGKNLIYLRSFWIFAATVNGLALIMSGTRGAILGITIATIFIAAVYIIKGDNNIFRRLSIVPFIGLLTITLLLLLGQGNPSIEKYKDRIPVFTRLTSISMDDASIISRKQTWEAGLRAFTDKPIFGWGPENFIVAWGRYFDESSGVTERFDQAHNKIIEELTTRGVTGLIAYLAIWIVLGTIIFKQFIGTRGGEQGFVILIAGGLCTYFVQNLFLFDTPTSYSQFVIMLAVVVSLPNITGEGESSVEEEAGPQSNTLRAYLPNFGNRLKRSHTAVIAAGVAVPLILFALYYLNVQPYKAAQHVLAGKITAQQGRWNEAFPHFKSALANSHGMSNQPRFQMLKEFTQGWPNMTESERKTSIDIMEEESHKAIALEPDNFRVHYFLSRYYMVAATLQPDLLKRAQVYLLTTERLGPRTIESRVGREIYTNWYKIFGISASGQ